MADIYEEIRRAENRMRQYAQEEGERAVKEAVNEVVNRKMPLWQSAIHRMFKKEWEADIWSRMPQNSRRKGTPRGHVHEQPTVGGGADCMFDYLISTCWEGQEGQIFESLTGCEFRVYSTLTGAFTHAATLAANSDRVFYICPSTYSEAVTKTPPNSANWDIYGGGAGNTIWNPGANSATCLALGTMTSGTRVRVTGINFDTDSYTSANGVTSNNGLFFFQDCVFDTGTTSSVGLNTSNTLEQVVSRCYFTGSGTGYSPSIAQMTVFDDCYFDCETGLSITGNRVGVYGSIFNCGTSDITVSTGGEISIVGNPSINKGITITGAPLDNLEISANTFRLGSGETGINCNPSVNSEGWVITSNTFKGNSNSIGIALDAQMTSGVVALNSFQGFTSGNEITGTGGAALQGFHNSSSDGSAGTNQYLADFGPVVGHSGSSVTVTPAAQIIFRRPLMLMGG